MSKLYRIFSDDTIIKKMNSVMPMYKSKEDVLIHLAGWLGGWEVHYRAAYRDFVVIYEDEEAFNGPAGKV